MARRIDIELTSSKEDGSWTWRAAGARQPKGVLAGSLLHPGAKVGEVLRAEAEFEIEGITITAVYPPREKRSEPDRLEIIGPSREFQGVTSSLVPKNERRRDDDRRGPRRDRPDDARRGPRPGGDRARSGRPSGERPPGDRATGERGPQSPADRGRPPGERGGRPTGERGSRPPTERTARTGADRGPRPDRAERPGRAPGERPARGGEARHEEAARTGPPRPKRLSPGNTHRQAVLNSLTPEHRPIAEQVLRGGIPAVRQAIEQQNAQARAEGHPEVKPGPLLGIAEDLLPRLKAADWRDRAEAAAAAVDEIGLRDLRSVVTGADAGARDDESRLLASTLRQALERRVDEQRDAWIKDITGALDEGRLVRALRTSARPPDPTSRIPAELAIRLSDAAGAAMAPDAPPERWSALLEAVAASPVRRSVKPVGLPPEPGDALLEAAKQTSGRVPAIAALLGIEMPPPPGPPRPGRAPGRRPPPPPPARPPAPPAPPVAEAAPPPAAVDEPAPAAEASGPAEQDNPEPPAG